MTETTFFGYPEWLELLNFNFKLTVSFHCSIVGIFKIIRKTSRLLHRNLILGRPFRFFEVIALFFDDVNFSIIYSFFFAFFQKACRILKKCKDGGLSLLDEILISWRRKHHLPCQMQL